MNYLNNNETIQRGTFDFPLELYHIDSSSPRYKMLSHWHVEYEIIKVCKGTLRLTLNDKSFTLYPDDIAFVLPGVLHGAEPDNAVYEVIVFDFEKFFKRNVIDNYKVFDFNTSKYDIQQIFFKGSTLHKVLNEIFETVNSDEDGCKLVSQGLIGVFMGLILKYKAYSKKTSHSNKCGRKVYNLKNALDKIKHDYPERITLTDLADCANMSPKYFCRMFQEMTGKTPIEYLNFYRIEAASTYLVNTDKSITDIAVLCGFKDLSYFIKTFKMLKGVSPNKFRKFDLLRKRT